MVEDLHTKIKSRVDGIMLGLDARVLSLSNSLDNLEKEVEQATTNDVAKANQTRPYFEAKRVSMSFSASASSSTRRSPTRRSTWSFPKP